MSEQTPRIQNIDYTDMRFFALLNDQGTLEYFAIPILAVINTNMSDTMKTIYTLKGEVIEPTPVTKEITMQYCQGVEKAAIQAAIFFVRNPSVGIRPLASNSAQLD